MGIMQTEPDFQNLSLTDTGKRWNAFNQLRNRESSKLILNKNIRREYIKTMLMDQLEDGIQYYESRHSMDDLYFIGTQCDDSVCTKCEDSKCSLNDSIQIDISLTNEVIDEMKKNYSQFIGFKRIIANKRNSTLDEVSKNVQLAIDLKQRYPHHIIGFDLVAEEDQGRSLLYYLDVFLNNSSPDLPFYFHAGETNWFDDLLTTSTDDDPVATLENLVDAIALNTKRIGHGIGLIKYPELLKTIKTNGIAIEICPLSNQFLGYTPDLRNHPGLTYYLYGIPIVISSDDPGMFGYNNVSLDWYQVYMAWGLNLADLKRLANNSLQYSGMNISEKKEAMQKWEAQWNNFITVINDEACHCPNNCYAKDPQYKRIFPSIAPTNKQINITIFGRNFQRAICNKIVCKFDNIQSQFTKYVTNYRIICEVPKELSPGTAKTSKLEISMDGGTLFNFVGIIHFKNDVNNISSATKFMPAYYIVLFVSSHFIFSRMLFL